MIHHHYHQTPSSERTVSALLSSIGSDAARNVGSDLLAGAVVADSAVVGKILADRKKKRRQLEARPAESRGGDPASSSTIVLAFAALGGGAVARGE